jgi:hypothetical protein
MVLHSKGFNYSSKNIGRKTEVCLRQGNAGFALPYGDLLGRCVGKVPLRKKKRYSRCYSGRVFEQRPNRPGVLLLRDSRGVLRSCGSAKERARLNRRKRK